MNKTYYVKIEGIFCDHCRITISSFIKKADTDALIKISGSIAKIQSVKLLEPDIIDAVKQAGYTTKQQWICTSFNKWKLLQILQSILQYPKTTKKLLHITAEESCAILSSAFLPV